MTVIVLLSFFHFSFYYSPLLNSDSALGILMAKYLDLPVDLYCWGQDRGGNFIPILGRILSSITSLPLIISLSIVHFSILILGYCGYASFIKSNFIKIALAAFWFLPPWQFVEFLLYPYGIQYSILGIILYLMARSEAGLFSGNRTLNLIGVGLLSIVGVWVSDFLMISFIAILLAIATGQERSQLFNLKTLLWLGFTTVSGAIFIIYAKVQSVPSASYSSFQFNDLNEVTQAIALTWASIQRIFLFHSESVFQSIFWITAVLLASIFIYQLRSKQIAINDRISQRLTRLMLINTVLTFVILFAFNWVLLNEMGRRYFSCLFISGVLTFLFFLDGQFSDRLRHKIVLIVLAVLSMASALENFYYPSSKKAKSEYVKEINTLEPAGIIGDYWNSYVYSSLDPTDILTTPHDNSVYRNIQLVEKALSQPNLYLVKDMWLSEFPDTIRQFGRYLIRSGQSFHLGDSDFCQYQVDTNFYNFSYRPFIPSALLIKARSNSQHFLDATKLQFNGYTVYDSLSTLKQTIQLAPYSDANHSTSVIAKLNLTKGKYSVLLNLRLADQMISPTRHLLSCTIGGLADTYLIKNIERSELRSDEVL